jgi:hypothetical protein
MRDCALTFTVSHFFCRVNICPYQGSRTIRSEEAVLIGLAKFSPLLAAASASSGKKGGGTKNSQKVTVETPKIEFTDEEPSDESSESEAE